MHIYLITPHFFWNTYSPEYSVHYFWQLNKSKYHRGEKVMCWVKQYNLCYCIHSRDHITRSRLANSSPFWSQRRTNLHPYTPRHTRTFHLSHIHTPSCPPPLHPPHSQTARVPTAPKPQLKPLLTPHATRPCLSIWIHPSFPAFTQRAKRLMGTETMGQCRHNKQWPMGQHHLPLYSQNVSFPLFSVFFSHSIPRSHSR